MMTLEAHFASAYSGAAIVILVVYGAIISEAST